MEEKFKSKCFFQKKSKKLMQVMRLSILLLFISTFTLFANDVYSQRKELSVHVRNAPLREAFSKIEKSSDYVFIITDDACTELNKRVNIVAENESINKILDILLRNTDLGYRVVERQISVYLNNTPKVDAAEQQPPQKDITVKGSVTDKYKEALPGVTVIIKGTTRGATTDADGNFTLTFQANEMDSPLQISCVGFKSKEVQIGDEHFLNIILDEDVSLMEELVVIGYGSKDKKSLTSSISSMRADDVERLAATVPSVDALLGGAVKGVFSTQKSGAPGEGLVINVRGITSPTGSAAFTQSNAPLYVIDGMPYFVGDSKLNPLLVISPNDIESIDILKDASATAIYGSRGANGVVIVKTKNGRKGEKVSIDAGYTYSAANPVKQHKPLSIAEFKQWQDQIIKGTVAYFDKEGIPAEVFPALEIFAKIKGEIDPSTGKYKNVVYNGLNESAFGKNFTNWNDAVTTKNAGAHQYYVSLRGGSETTNYSASINALNQQGIMINDDFSRYGMRLSLDTDIGSRVHTGAALNYSVSSRKYGGVSHEVFASEPHPWRMRPDIPIYDENGDFMRYRDADYPTTQVFSPNPVAKRSQKNKFGSQQFMGSGYINIDIIDGLQARAEMNISSFAFKTNAFRGAHTESIFDGAPVPGALSESTQTSTYTSLNFRLDYSKKVGEHNFAAMAGVGSERSYHETRSIDVTDFFNESVLNNIGSANTYYPSKDGYGKGGLNSAYSRLSYDYDYRYLLEMSLRGDASSKFGPDNRLAIFPALSMGWRINQEAFMKENTWIDDLKLRLSWGKTGSTNVDDFSYLRYYSKTGQYAGKPEVHVESTFPNREVGWEKTTEYNGGLDFSFFNRRLFGSIDIYNRVTKGSLSNAPFIMESGMSTFQSNLIDMVNRGFELEIGSNIIRSENFYWTSTLNASSNKNKVLKLNGANLSRNNQDLIIEGQPIGVIKGYKVKEIVSDPATIATLNEAARKKGHKEYMPGLSVGDNVIEDTNNDGKITTDDRVVLGSPHPYLFGGWNNIFRYRNIELSCLMQFSLGGEAIFSDISMDLIGNLGYSITRHTFGNTWTPENKNATYPRVTTGRYQTFNNSANNRTIYDRSYLRVKNITLSYDLDPKTASVLGMTGISLFTSITNILTFTKWPGLDPELVGSNLFAGSSKQDPYPLSRTVSVGFRIRM